MPTVPNWEDLPPAPATAPNAQPQSFENLPSSFEDLPAPEASEENDGGVGGSLRSFARAAVSGNTLGASHIGDSEETKEEQSKHGVANFLGELTGSAALLAETEGFGVPALATRLGLTGISAAALTGGIGGAAIGAGHALTNDLALGDPGLNAGKIASDMGTAALWNFNFGALGSAAISGLLSGGPALVKGAINKFATPSLDVAPESLGWIDKIRMGLFSGMRSPEAQQAVAQKTSDGLNALHNVASMDNLEAFGGAAPEIEAFNSARSAALKHFGDGKQINPEEILSHLAAPASKSSTQGTIVLNNLFKATKDLSNVNFSDANVSAAVKSAQSGLDEWTSALGDYATQGPHVDLEYGGPGMGDFNNQPKPYSSTVDTIPSPQGKVTSPGLPGITVNGGTRINSYGNESVSPYLYEGPSLDHINKQIGEYQQNVMAAAEKEANASGIVNNIKNAAAEAQSSNNPTQNLMNANNAIQNPPQSILNNPAADVAAYAVGGKKAVAGLEAIKLIYKFSGEGGAYRLGNALVTPSRLANGISNVLQRVDQSIGNGARLIFTGSSDQARKIADENE